MKIFLGVGDIGNVLNMWADGFRSLGHDALTAVHSKNPFFSHISYDKSLSKWDKKLFGKDIPHGGYKLHQFPQKGFNLTSRLFQSLALISRFDVFLFLTPEISIFRPDFDFGLIKLLKKKLVVICAGSDVRHVSGFSQEFCCEKILFDSKFTTDTLQRPLSNLRRAEKYADLIYSLPDQSSLAIRDYNHFQIPINPAQFDFHFPDRDVPVVLHAPSRRGIKGTVQILDALEGLRNEGINFELRLLENVSNDRIKEQLVDADLLVDEIVLHGPGILSLEAMCSGCSVATKYLQSSPEFFKPPVYATDNRNLYDNLKRLLTNRELRKKLAYEGRSYVEKNNHYVALSRKILEDLERCTTKEFAHDYEAKFFKEKYVLPKSIELSATLKKSNLEIARKYWPDFELHQQSLKERRLI